MRKGGCFAKGDVADFQDPGDVRKPPTCVSLDGPIRANRFADSRESPDSRESFQGPRTEPLFLRIALRGQNILNRRFEAIRANRSHAMKKRICLRIDSRAPIRVANRRAI